MSTATLAKVGRATAGARAGDRVRYRPARDVGRGEGGFRPVRKVGGLTAQEAELLLNSTPAGRVASAAGKVGRGTARVAGKAAGAVADTAAAVTQASPRLAGVQPTPASSGLMRLVIALAAGAAAMELGSYATGRYFDLNLGRGRASSFHVPQYRPLYGGPAAAPAAPAGTGGPAVGGFIAGNLPAAPASGVGGLAGSLGALAGAGAVGSGLGGLR